MFIEKEYLQMILAVVLTRQTVWRLVNGMSVPFGSEFLLALSGVINSAEGEMEQIIIIIIIIIVGQKNIILLLRGNSLKQTASSFNFVLSHCVCVSPTFQNDQMIHDPCLS